ncbi:MAG: DNA mismatch repair endonuclease MutL [Lentisphaeria bacterium]|jgi:DNA mismatch repair protein MutL
MSLIRVLPDEIANRIAAGEVIERPASVVKELAENAIDAGARRIVIHSRNGGKSLIQVQDDGGGMDRDDALLCLEPHATSKIRQAADIEHIVTLGFRGEALPSIASVSRFQLQTRQADALEGTEVRVEGGTLRDCRACGCAPGTSVRVAQLFFNLPGRRKFLRGATTESEHIQETVLLQALAHPGVAFELIVDDQPALQVSASGDPGTRVAMLLGRDLFAALLPVAYEEAGIRVHGFIARPGFTRGTRREQRFFVNGRPAAADCLFFAARDAYHTLVMKGRYPPLILYVEAPPDAVDVNVHPAKREVRFRDALLTGQVVAAAVRRALRALAGEPALQPSLAAVAAATPAAPGRPLASQGARFPTPPQPLTLTPPEQQPEMAGLTPTPPRNAPPPSAPATAPAGTSVSSATRAEIRALRILGTLNNLYLVAEGAAGLVLIDQHAAHERILFEKLLRAAESAQAEGQPLLIPVHLDLAPADAALLRHHLEHFHKLGFGLDAFGGNSFLVTAVPAGFPGENLGGLLRDILDDLRQAAASTPRPDELRIAQAACKHAVKAEDPLRPLEVNQLLHDLAAAEMPYTCPHGRPVMITIPHPELERRFGRRA